MDSNSPLESRPYSKSPAWVPAHQKPPTAAAKTPLLQTDPKGSPHSIHGHRGNGLLYLPNKWSSNRLIFPQLRRENRLADLGLDQKGNFFKQLHGIIKNTHTHNTTTTTTTTTRAGLRILTVCRGRGGCFEIAKISPPRGGICQDPGDLCSDPSLDANSAASEKSRHLFTKQK